MKPPRHSGSSTSPPKPTNAGRDSPPTAPTATRLNRNPSGADRHLSKTANRKPRRFTIHGSPLTPHPPKPRFRLYLRTRPNRHFCLSPPHFPLLCGFGHRTDLVFTQCPRLTFAPLTEFLRTGIGVFPYSSPDVHCTSPVMDTKWTGRGDPAADWEIPVPTCKKPPGHRSDTGRRYAKSRRCGVRRVRSTRGIELGEEQVAHFFNPLAGSGQPAPTGRRPQ